jgi:hypothetical protein
LVEKISSLSELQNKYELVTGRRPEKRDLVYVPALQGVFEVVHADRMTVKIERGQKGSGLFVVLPFSHYKLIELKKRSK